MKTLKDTIFLPKTDYQLRPDFLTSEPALIAGWNEKELYNSRNDGKTEMFVLHDGPPYANGNIHIGHAMNKIHKDIIARAQSMAGKAVSFIPGWDCHGLPIEWKIEEKYRAAGKNKNDVSILEFRKECRDYAAEWVKVQSEEFQRLGIAADWTNPYVTMDYETEAWIASEVRGFSHGNLYRDFRPVMWSPVEQTSLAEAEVEYEDKKITSIYVKFPLSQEKYDVKNCALIAWTTTPWTIPANRALAMNPKLDYSLYVVLDKHEYFDIGEYFVLAENLFDTFKAEIGLNAARMSRVDPKKLAIPGCKHPLFNQGYTDDVPILLADFVTDETGTGIVHLAPSHGLDDFYLCKTHGIGPTDYVTKNGTYKSDLPLFGGIHVYKALEPVLEALRKAGALAGVKPMTHSTAVSWRSKAPLIYLATPQWFISMDNKGSDGKSIRERCLEALNDVTFIPEAGRTRLSSMIESRPDWCISRQRAWGVPITLFVHKQTGEILHDCEVDGNIHETFRSEGSDAWYKHDAAYFLNGHMTSWGVPEEKWYNPDDYEMIMDVVDVWFESGASYAYVLKKRGLPKADVYLEGSDQHRGWFQASLIESCATRGSAPFKTIITDGFVLDKNGRKMAKSLNNVVPPQDIIKDYGADVLRLWVANSDTTEDIRIGDPLIKQQSEIYRKLRNTLKYLVGALSETKMTQGMPDVHTAYASDEAKVYLEQYMLLKVDVINRLVLKAIDNHDWKKVVTEIHNFCANDLSIYFDARKDVLYCGQGQHTPNREVTMNMMAFLFHTLVRWLAPIIPFATEEAWQAVFGNVSSVHMLTFDIQKIDLDMEEIDMMFEFPEFWQKIKSVRSSILQDLEVMRTKKQIGSALEASVNLDHTLYWKLDNRWVFKDWESFLGVSGVNSMLSPQGSLFQVRKVIGNLKCERCWKVVVNGSLAHPDETNRPRHDLCKRCKTAVEPFGELE